ncbi:murein biosynthesis integral membrane protein MurJ [Enterovirga aerilata]|uniref:Probable lipid II flippase MurJ n=1 Tax=Enterovirga aerilata TaxID=2730920 RepID=A0A849I8E3_9HYPH|nr:murein biosynthesis integral membrane protein MurJ [Enterovirga sp. DB1703]NNM72679.1 murein biosynthesis integral membrane protein MurJ [Enterovirga sp. DB1703]
MFKKILSVGGWTLVSRITGFVRDVVMAAIMGAGPITDAFVVAFRLPNHFRAIFGEGAFNAAFVPTYGRVNETEGAARAAAFANRVYTLMLAVQALLLLVALAAMPAFVSVLAPGLRPETFELAVTLTRITFPYLLLITLVTLISAVLNARDRFWAAAAAPILLNLSMIAMLAVAWLFPTAGHAAALGVLLSGALQLGLVWWDAARAGLAPRLANPRGDPEMGGFFKRLGPAVIGSAGIQIAMFADTIIGSLLPTGALSSLYYAERLYQLPLGVVGIAAGTVLLPTMSRLVAAGDPAGAHAAQNRAVGFTLALAAPCAVAFLVLPDLVMAALFQRGAFDAAAAARSGEVLAAYAVGLPAAVIIRSVTASFYARGDTTTPLWASLAGYGVNVALKLVLIGPFGVAGLALATSVGAWINVGVLWFLAVRRDFAAPSRALAKTLAGIGLSCALLAALAAFGRAPVATALTPLGPLRDIGTLGALGLAGLLLYGAALALCLRLFGLRLRRI